MMNRAVTSSGVPILSGLAIMWLACSLLLAAGCSSDAYEGNLVDVQVKQGQTTASTESGEWNVSAFLLAPTAVEIIPCAALSSAKMPASAGAKHVESTPFQSGRSLVWPIVGGASELYRAGDIEPPSDEYCAVRLLIAPLDNDGIRGEEFKELVGHSLLVQASVTSPAQSAPIAVLATGTLRVETEIPLDHAPVVIDGPASLVLSIDVATTLAGIDPADAPAQIARGILAAVPNAVSARIDAND